MLNISIRRGTPVSIHQQLVTQLSLQIAAGVIPEGNKLPSVRAMSKRLNIHYNTCLAVYKELSELGMIDSKKGIGVVVRRFKPGVSYQSLERGELSQIAKYFIKIVQEKGYSWSEVELALKLEREHIERPLHKLAFVDIHSDILPIFQAELEYYLNQPIRIIDLASLNPAEEDPSTCFLVSRYHYCSLKERLGSDENILIIDVGANQEEMELIKTLPTGELIAIISSSRVILEAGESIVSSLRGYDILINRALTSETTEDEIRSILKCAKLVFSDFLSARKLGSYTRKPLHVIRVLLDSEICKIKAHLKL